MAATPGLPARPEDGSRGGSAPGAGIPDPEYGPEYGPRGRGRAALTSYCLGICTGAALIAAVLDARLVHWSAYMAILCFFHEVEFLLTAAYRPDTLSADNFLLNHSKAYHVAVLLCWAEFWLEWWLFGAGWKRPGVLSASGLALTVVALFSRSLAMSTSASNFSHTIETEKRPQHRLVKHGIYRYLRHPAYFGFFWFSVGTQLLLLNPVCTVLYAYASWKFFADRIPYEEELLHEFFPEYARYTERTIIGIPLILRRNS
ncbi:Isoprenylcysteine carboxyl methyltransferase family-domain-containing protein [Pavlovales sp. CCMP2436]|nr:Isoprenylcysteine carboxyl methyltransferase family-domain-containing protein [Pavlovales sp. CCMP2436]